MDKDLQSQLDELTSEIELLRAQGNLEEALAKASLMIELIGADRTSDSASATALAAATASALRTQASIYEEIPDFGAAIECYIKALPLLRSALGDRHPDIAITLHDIAFLSEVESEYDVARVFYEEAVALQRLILDSNHPDLAHTLTNLGSLYNQLGEYELAQLNLEESLRIRRHRFGDHHPDVASTLSSLASVYRERGDYAAAEPLYEEAVEIQRRLFWNTQQLDGEDGAGAGEEEEEGAPHLHPDFYAADLANLAGIYSKLHKYSAAAECYTLMVKAKETINGEDDVGVVNGLILLSEAYASAGRFGEAIDAYERALSIFRASQFTDEVGAGPTTGYSDQESVQTDEQKLSDDSHIEAEENDDSEESSQEKASTAIELARLLNNLADLYTSAGKYSKALELYQEALALHALHRGVDHPDYARNLNNLAWLHEQLGNYGVSEQYYKQVLDILAKNPGIEHPDFAIALNNLGLLYHATGRFQEAEAAHLRSLGIREQCFGDKHQDVAVSLSNLANVYHSQGLYSKAEDLLLRAAEIDLMALGKGNPLYAADLNNLGLLYSEMGKYEDAEKALMGALDIWRATLGDTHPDIGTALNNLAALSAAKWDLLEAVRLFEEEAVIEDELMRQVFSVGSDLQRLHYLEASQTHLHSVISFALAHSEEIPEYATKAFALLLRRKGVGAEALVQLRESTLATRYPELEYQYRELVRLRRLISARTLAGPGGEDSALFQSKQALLVEERELLESSLAARMPEAAFVAQFSELDIRSIASKLESLGSQGSPGNQTALIEFVELSIRNFQAVPARGEATWSVPRYVAFVVRAVPQYSVQMVDLGDVKDVDELIDAMRFSIGTDPNARSVRDEEEDTEWNEETFLQAGNKLCRILFDPLLPMLAGCTQLFLAPDGNLARLPFEILPAHTSAGEGHRYMIDDYRISYLNTGRELLRQALPQTDLLSGRASGYSIVIADPDFDLGEPSTHTLPEESEIEQESESLRASLRDIRFERLAGTRLEGQQVAHLLGVKPILGPDVLEERLRACRSPEVLHIATHGFFLPGAQFERAAETATEFVKEPVRDLLQIVNPMLRSGLALAGANSWLSGGKLPWEAEDGLLTAEDIASIDLSSTRLVVLSACDTGLGHIQVGEGVFGLRRAVFVAGAQSLVMSLWRVPDRQTQELMLSFYGAIQRGLACGDALRITQLALRDLYPNPLYWGGFICAGDPGPINWRSDRETTGTPT